MDIPGTTNAPICDATEGTTTVHYNIQIGNNSNVIIGCQNVASSTEDAQKRIVGVICQDSKGFAETLLKVLRHNVQKILGQDIDSVTLDVIRLESQYIEEFGDAIYSYAKWRPGNELIDSKNLFQASKRNAELEAEVKCYNQQAIDDHVMCNGNVVGMTGVAGIGKSTFGKQQLGIHLSDDNALIFHVLLKDFDINKEISVFEFLTKSIKVDWKLSEEDDKSILRQIAKTQLVFINLDGLDESGMQNLHASAPTMSLVDHCKPDVILKNLLSGRILPHALKLLNSRPNAYHLIHPDYKPHFTVVVIGLSDESQQKMLHRICLEQEELNKVVAVLDDNPYLKSLCYLPIFFRTLIKVVNQRKRRKIFTLVSVFSSFCLDRVRDPKFEQRLKDKNNVESKRKPFIHLSLLAFKGMCDEKFVFEVEDLEEVDSELHTLEAFLTLYVSCDSCSEKVLDGDKFYFFVHLLWQEYFAAMWLMFKTNTDEFGNFLERINSPKWEMVRRFLYGLLDKSLMRELKYLYKNPKNPQDPQALEEKSAALVKNITEVVSQYAKNAVNDFPVPLASLMNEDSLAKWNSFQTRGDDRTLFNLCALAFESRNDDIARLVAKNLSSCLLISKIVSLSDVTSFCYVLKHRREQIVINIGAYYEPAIFVNNGLQVILQEAKNCQHAKIAKLHVRRAPQSTIGLLAQFISHVKEFSVESSDLTKENVFLFTQELRKRSEPIDVLNLSVNTLDDEGTKLLAQTVGKVNRLILMECNLTTKQLQLLTSAIKNAPNQVAEFNVSLNQMSIASIADISTCLGNLDELEIFKCGINEQGMKAICGSIAKRQTKMKWLMLNDNKIGREGVSHLSNCVSKIKCLSLSACHINGEDLRCLTQAINQLKEPMKYLNVNGNKLGDVGAHLLAECRFNIEVLRCNDCGFTTNGQNIIESAEKALNKPKSESVNRLGIAPGKPEQKDVEKKETGKKQPSPF